MTRPRTNDAAEPPRDFGRDGVSGLVTTERALRARDVSRPQPPDYVAAEEAVRTALERVTRRR